MHGLSLWLAVEPPAYLLLHVSSLAYLVRRITSLLACSAARPDEPVCTAWDCPGACRSAPWSPFSGRSGGKRAVRCGVAC